MDYSGKSGLALTVGILIGFLFVIIVFLIGFLPGWYLTRRIVSDKKGKLYLKSKNARFLISLCIALICGYASYVILYPVLLRLKLFG